MQKNTQSQERILYKCYVKHEGKKDLLLQYLAQGAEMVLCPRHISVKILKLLPDVGDDIPHGSKDILGVPIRQEDDGEIE